MRQTLIGFELRRKFFDDYLEEVAGSIPARGGAFRSTCPCCGYPTLGGRGHYEICFLCNWEDDGADDPQRHERSVPNHGITLDAARLNFADHATMYEIGADPRVGGADSPAERRVKERAIRAFESMRERELGSRHDLWEIVVAARRELSKPRIKRTTATLD